MLGVFKICAKLLQMILNILFVLQIILMVLVFLTAAYWFFSLINISALDFAAPLAQNISDLVTMFHQADIEVGGVYIDGSLLLFDIVALGVVFLLAKSKYYLYLALDFVNTEIDKCLQRIEDEFNKKLKNEMESQVKKANNAAILVQFEAKSLMMDAMMTEGKSPADIENEAFKTFYATIKSISGCKFAKTDDKMLILLDNFNNIDNLLHFIDLSISRIRKNMKAKRWALFSYISVDVFDNKTNFKKDIYPMLEKLLTLHHKNEAICLGNFRIRYDLNKNPMYTPFKKGAYNLGDEELEVWALIKKN